MTVRELLDRIDSHELAEWQAYEKANGPIGPAYEQGTLAGMHEQLQMLNYLTGASFESNPAPAPQRWATPDEVFLAPAEDEKAERAGNADELNAFFDNK